MAIISIAILCPNVDPLLPSILDVFVIYIQMAMKWSLKLQWEKGGGFHGDYMIPELTRDLNVG